jgi:hypothetical protein
MFDLGDPVPLAITVRNASGTPENATTVVLTITLPDLTTVTPTVTGVAGVYATDVPYVATLAGHYAVRWVATGTNACTQSDVFNVYAADAGQLISLADARAALGTQTANTVKDEDLRSAIADATPIMEDLCGPLLRRTRVETYDGGTSQIALLFAPLISITSIVESYGSTYTRTLTAQDTAIFAGTGSDAYGYTVDLTTGIVTRRAVGVAIPFMAGKRNVQVTYVSGRASIGGNILRATRLLVRQLWLISGQQGNRPQMGTPDTSVGHTPSGFAVPNAVIEMVGGADTRAPGLA